jgi:uncharacterized membrane protein
MEESYKNRITEEANDPAHYKLITIGVIIGMLGIMLRFTGTWPFINTVSNILFIIGIVICLRAVLRILK